MENPAISTAFMLSSLFVRDLHESLNVPLTEKYRHPVVSRKTDERLTGKLTVCDVAPCGSLTARFCTFTAASAAVKNFTRTATSIALISEFRFCRLVG